MNSYYSSFLYYDKMLDIITFEHGSPNILEYSFIAQDMKDLINRVLFKRKNDKQVLRVATLKSAKCLGV